MKIGSKKTVLVTGGAGYIGSVCVQELIKKNYNVVVFDNLEYGHKHNLDFNKCKLIVGDLREYRSILRAMEETKPDAVMHFAAYALVGESCKDPLKYFNNNVTGGINLLMAMEAVGCKRLIFSSTCATYGIPDFSKSKSKTITEDTPQHPINPYGASKHIFEQVIKSYAMHKSLKYTIFRYFNACGAAGGLGEEHFPETHLIPNALNSALDAQKRLEVFGDDYSTPDGTCIRDYIHVSDLAEAHVKALVDGIYGEFNLGTGKGISVKEIVSLVEQVTKKKSKHKICNRRPGDPDLLVADPSKAQNALKWKAKKTAKDAVEDAYSFMTKKERNS